MAASAQCSVRSLYAAFGGGDDLLHAVYDRHSPIVDVETVIADAGDDLETTVRRIYRSLVHTLERRPRALPAILAEVLARPGDDGIQAMFQHAFPRLVNGVGRWLADQAAAGRIGVLLPNASPAAR